MSDEQNSPETPEETNTGLQTAQELLQAIVQAKPGGQTRSQQIEAVESISYALKNNENLILEAPTGSGKALHVNTPILTDTGFKTMGDLTEEDRVYGTQGKLINILEAHDKYAPEELYELSIENGTKVITDGRHLWVTHYRKGTDEEIEEVIKQLKSDLEAIDSFPEKMTASSLMYMMPYVPENARKHFKKMYEKEVLVETTKLLEDFYLFLRTSAGTEVLTTGELYARYINKEDVHLVSFTNELQWGSNELNTLQLVRLAKKLSKANFVPEGKLIDLTVKSKKELLKLLIIELGETNPNGTGNYYLTVPNKESALQVKQMIASLGHKNYVLTPSGRVGFQSKENLLEGTKSSDRWRKPYDSFYENDYIIVNKIEKIQNVEKEEVRCITVDSEDHLFLFGEEFVPTHNTLSYLIPSVFHQTRTVISTATKQLSEQIVNLDIPFVQKIVQEVSPGHTFTAALLKGRENYFCPAKAHENRRLSEQAEEGLFGIEEVQETPTSSKGKLIAGESLKIVTWADSTKTGDRSEAPAVSDETWRRFSSTSAECPGKSVCSFSSECFSEKAREIAKDADIVVTNHAVVANDLRTDEAILLGERDTYIFDEMHELDSYLSGAWGVSLTSKTLKDSVRKFGMISGVTDSMIEDYESLGKKFNALAEKFDVGLIEEAPKVFDSYMSQLYKAANGIAEKANSQSTDKGNSEAKKKQGSQVFKQAKEIADAALMLMNDNAQEIVRWVVEDLDKKTGESSRTFRATLLRVGPMLQESLAEREANMIGTSATIRVSGSFEIPVHNLDLKSTGVPFKTKELSSPFEYRKQAMIYIPDPTVFPAPDYKTRDQHSEAVRNEALALITAMGGRALSLHTTTFEMRKMGDFLKKKLKNINVLVQGDAPNQQLIDEFKEDPTSVLVATMGMWHGLDVPGPALALVMMDKIPFTPMNDPLSKARQNWADANGRSGFNDVYVADANIMLAQGAGRLVRSETDKGIIAIFDTRLRTKGYAKGMTKSLPDAGYYMDREKVIAAATRLGKTFE